MRALELKHYIKKIHNYIKKIQMESFSKETNNMLKDIEISILKCRDVLPYFESPFLKLAKTKSNGL